MPERQSEQLDRTFAALGDPTRRAILRRLVDRDRTVSELAEPFAMSLPAVSKHLRVLERAGLVSRTVDGRTHTLHLEAEPMSVAAEWLTSYRKFWGGRLDALADFLEAPPTTPAARPNQKAKKQPKKRG